MTIIIINKDIAQGMNNMNTGMHKLNIMELKDGRAFVPAKVLSEPLYENYHAYLNTCVQIEITSEQILKPEINASNKI